MPPPSNPVPPDYFERFVEQLEGIRRATELTNKLIPEQAAETARKLVDFYDQGYSNRASRPSEPEWTQLPEDDEDLRRSAGNRARQQSGRSDSASTPPDLSHEHDRGASVEPPSVGPLRERGDWQKYAEANQGFGLSGLRYGQYSATDILGTAGSMLTTSATKAEARAPGSGDARGRAGYLFNYAAKQAPLFQAARQLAGKANVMIGPSDLTHTGSSLGIKASGGDVNIGPFGFRTPFNAATGAGISREWEIQKMRMGSGINGDQAREIFDLLNSKGFKSESDSGAFQGQERAMRRTPSFDHMTDTMKKITQDHPELLNEQTVTLMDKAVRYGSSSLDAFRRNMMAAADSARETGYSMDQLSQDMDAVGEVTQRQGGTHAQGQKTAVDFNSITKLPSALVPGLLENPLVQGYAMRTNGLLPWEQGLESGPQRTADISGAVNQMYDMMGPIPSRKIDAGGGFKGVIPSKDRKLALLAQQFPGTSPEYLRNLIDNQKTIQARATLGDQATLWSKSVGRANTAEEQKALFGHGRGHYGMLTHQMALAGFSRKEQDEVYNAGSAKAYEKPDSAKARELEDYLSKHKGDGTTANPGATEASFLATKRANKIKDLIASKDEKVPSDHVVTIKLSKGARNRGFYLDNKNDARGGKSSTNVPFVGPTQNPGQPDQTGVPYDPTDYVP